ncbi:MAG: alkaline phosphatase family protein [Candidatus Rokubacteria bacterium]|nr:alkaline phosphatase family protein [Candidatus Rokubacteria bacterium]
MIRALLGVCTLALFVVAGGAGATASRHLVLVSIDGLRPHFYLDASFAAPELRGLAARGSHARAAEAVFPTVTYPNHASIVTGVRPLRHGIAFNVRFEPSGTRGRWYEEAADLKAPPLWEWARAAGLKTASVSWPATLGARIDLLLPERAYYVRREPLDLLRAAVTPGFFALTRVEPEAGMFRDVTRWDDFLARTAAALIREARPNLLLLHLVQTDYFQHHGGRDGAEVKPAVARVDAHVGALVAALQAAGIADRTTMMIVGDHGFQDYARLVSPNEILVRAGLRACRDPETGWRATVHVAGGAAGVFVNPAGDADVVRLADAALRSAAAGRYTVLTRRELDALGAMPGAALGIEAAPGWSIDGGCGRGIARSSAGGMHGFLPSRAEMATGFLAAGAGVRSGVVVDRVRLIDVAPTAARLLGIPAPAVEGRVLTEILAP